MAKDDDVHSGLGQRFFVGLSTIFGVTVAPGQVGAIYKYFSGGTLEIGGATLTWGNGYVFAVGEAISMDSAGTFYFASTGSTSTLMVLRGRSAGIE
jgi:hypothetical protein